MLARRAFSEDLSGFGREIGFLEDGGVFLLDLSTLTLTHYNLELRETLRVTPPGAEHYYAAWADPGGRYFYCGHERGIARFALPGGEETVIPLGLPEGWMFSGFAGVRNGELLCALTGPGGLGATGVIGGDGRMRLSPFPASFTWTGSGTIYQLRGGGALFGTLPHDGSLRRVRSWREHEYVLDDRDSLVFSGSWSEKEPLRLYDLDKGLLVNELDVKGLRDSQYYDLALLCGDSYLLLCLNDYERGEYTLCLWDYSVGRLDAQAGIEGTTLAGVRREHDAKAAEIAGRHGISIYIRGAGAAFENDTYQGRVLEDELRLSAALDELDAFLGSLPAGMVKEALIRPYTRFAVYLCGGIVPKGAQGISSASGLSSSFGEERYIALNAYDSSFTRNLAHEFMHVMEDRIWEEYYEKGTGLIGRWGWLGPEDAAGFGFVYSYHNADMTEFFDTGFTAESADAAEQPGEVWFVDAYSRTYPLEDRARLFEYLFTAEDGSHAVFTYPNLHFKAQCLGAVIRESFPSVRALPQASWEKWLEPVSTKELESLIDTMIPEEALQPAG